MNKQTIPSPPVLPRTGVESHAHLDSKQFRGEIENILNRAQAAGVAQIGQVFLSPEAYRAGKGVFDRRPEVFFLLGIHPTEAYVYSEKIAEDIIRCVREDARIRCIGEIGLDYYWKEVEPALQRKVFIALLRLAVELDMPVALHCREAEQDTFDILEAEGFHDRPLVWHCFGGNAHMAQKIIEFGWHISIPGTVTFPKNTALREAVACIPQDRLMIETDCPYLAPMPFRGKRNEPALLPYTLAEMAQARRENPEELWTACGNNARRFFGLQ